MSGKSRYFYLKIEVFGFHMLSTIPPKENTTKLSNFSNTQTKTCLLAHSQLSNRRTSPKTQTQHRVSLSAFRGCLTTSAGSASRVT